MTHLDTEIKTLKSSVMSMWLMVVNQLEKAEKAITKRDKDLAKEIKVNEKRVDAYELKINMDCENILALFNPVAVDLRFVLAALKINYNLERIGDYAKSISDYTEEMSKHFDKKLFVAAGIPEMFALSFTMLNDALRAFENDDPQLVRSVYQLDDDLDKLDEKAEEVICEWIAVNPADAKDALYLHSIVKKLERVGDQAKNIATEIIFHTEAKMLHHKKKKKIFKALDHEQASDSEEKE
ncbi:MAG TPA: phosphate signaling complex protein PhoU [Bacteroidales bacterium]